MDNLETKHFVLIHGGGFGAWCWYKSIALLEEAGFVATALDLTGSGIVHTDKQVAVLLTVSTKKTLNRRPINKIKGKAEQMMGK